MSEPSRYDQRGVSATKEEVHQAIKGLDKGLFPNAFCKIIPDHAALDPAYCNLMHADTAGTKTSLAYLYWKESGDLSVWTGVAQDAIVMNLDDMACVGCTDSFVLSSTIGRNKRLIPGEVVATLIQAAAVFADTMQTYGIHIHLAGGETADVGDIVRTVDVGYTAFARMKREEVLEIKLGGMGSNGLTSARHDVLSGLYAQKYPESFDPQLPAPLAYSGSRLLTEQVDTPEGPMPIGKLILSPTRTYLPFLKPFIAQHRRDIRGIVHCTGGGQGKVLKFLQGKNRVVKDALLPVPPLFSLIQSESGASWREMYQVFNMGHRLELYLPQELAQEAIAQAAALGIEAAVIGRVEPADSARVIVESPYGQFEYENNDA
jgi:phosphoribosylformylglycinamidine cyclo-ligase